MRVDDESIMTGFIKSFMTGVCVGYQGTSILTELPNKSKYLYTLTRYKSIKHRRP